MYKMESEIHIERGFDHLVVFKSQYSLLRTSHSILQHPGISTQPILSQVRLLRLKSISSSRWLKHHTGHFSAPTDHHVIPQAPQDLRPATRLLATPQRHQQTFPAKSIPDSILATNRPVTSSPTAPDPAPAPASAPAPTPVPDNEFDDMEIDSTGGSAPQTGMTPFAYAPDGSNIYRHAFEVDLSNRVGGVSDHEALETGRKQMGFLEMSGMREDSMRRIRDCRTRLRVVIDTKSDSRFDALVDARMRMLTMQDMIADGLGWFLGLPWRHAHFTVEVLYLQG